MQALEPLLIIVLSKSRTQQTISIPSIYLTFLWKYIECTFVYIMLQMRSKEGNWPTAIRFLERDMVYLRVSQEENGNGNES